MAKVLNLPTELTLIYLSARCNSYVIIKKNKAFGRWLARLHSCETNRGLFFYSHFSHRIVCKKLLEMIEKRLATHIRTPIQESEINQAQ